MYRAHIGPLRRLTVAALALAVATASPLPAQSPAFDSPVVSTEWLAQHLNDPSLVVLHVAFNRREYTSGHIPGARFLWFNDIAPSNPDFSTELPPVARLDSLLESLGISDDSRVVIYGPSLTQFVARVYMTLDYLGAGHRAAVLDGGLNAWKAEARPVSTALPAVSRGRFTPRLNRDVVVDASFVRTSIDTPGVRILDARTPNFYAGEGGGPRPGHVPSAQNIPFTSLVDGSGKLKDRATIAGLFAGAGVQPSDRVVAYCHVGQQASLLYLAARVAGLRASLYDGSFEEWSARDDVPVAGPARK